MGDDYDGLERASKSKKRLVDHSIAWDKLTPVEDANGQIEERVHAFCVAKRIHREALTALGARIRVMKSGRIELAYAGTNGEGAIVALKYRPLDASSHDSYAAEPSTWLRPIIVGKQDSLDWVIAEGETDAARLWELVGDVAAIMALPAGARTFKREWAALIPRGATVALCHDADADGDAGAERAAKIVGGRTLRIRPPLEGSDWCDWDGTRDEFLALLRPVFSDTLHIVSLQEFVSVVEETAEPLLGTSDATILPRSGRMLMYGDGGAGKTTLSLDAAAHIASGTEWVGLTVEKPYRILIIENEGPRGKFRQRLDEKIGSWSGDPFASNVFVLEDPWTQFTFENVEHRSYVSQFCTETEIDIVMVGPLATVGMMGGGTPDEINRFTSLLDNLAAQSERAFALWIIHHENKAGDVSGAWERAPDTLLHVQAQGNGHTLLHWEKTRWSDVHHKTTLELVWTEGRSFGVVEKKERDPWVEMLEAFKQKDEWRTAKEAGKLIELSENEAKKVLAELTRRGDLKFEKGPSGRHHSALCWRLSGALMDLAHLSAPEPIPAGGGALDPLPPSLREGVDQRRSPETESSSAQELSAPTEEADDIPF